ncbi:phospholipid carrier-dependent glycosyltransferase [Actinomyces ruminis]|uniref:phospholipid carrier-dependent glycosyltransferase n=1 Tax=Actinomyces ruminis TaxID=1937003 RepID=UPI00211EBEB2|nr:phospholipid carrier-dependent glycosyltransferase [Actinomyces ruminis]
MTVSTAADAEADTGNPDVAEAPRSENQLRSLLGLEPLGTEPPRRVRINGWIATVVASLVAALTRLIGLGHPHQLMFDEIYYVKDAFALWHNGYESAWGDGADELFAQGDFSALTTDPSYVVHPQLGKWLIGLGMQIFGAESSFGWRIMPALAGILTVIVLVRLTLRLTRSPLLAGLAGVLLAIDGVGITESRIGLLDGFIGLFATIALYCLMRDREWSRARLATDLAGVSIDPAGPAPLAPRPICVPG